MASYDPMMLEVHVLLVDHDVIKLHETSKLLQFNSYKVTAVDDVSAASSMLSKGKTEFDLVMIDINSSNLEGYKLMHEAVNMNLTVILMSTNAYANATLVKCAIEDGAFLFMEKPTKVEELKYLWQHVLREKTRKRKGILAEALTNNHSQNYYVSGGEHLNNYNTTEGMTLNQYVSTNKGTCLKGTSEHICINSQNNFADPFMRSKFCTEWTPELHEKFMAAVKQLGEGRCFPKDILDLMNVPGLTRMQVASHLQKCRYGWQPPRERQGRRSKASKSCNSSDSHRAKIKRYGLFPRLIKGSQPQQNNQNDEPGLIATSANMENSKLSNGQQNMGEQGTLNISTVAHNNNMNGIPIESVLGNMGAAPNLGLLSDTTFDFLANDDGLIPNNFDLQDLDYDHIVPGQTTDEADRQKESEFWTSWVAHFARD